MNKNVTVVVPTFNRAHLLTKTIPSYLANDVVAELILVNDCSTDNTIEVVNRLSHQYSNVRLINLPHNSKQTVAKNVGMDQVTTEYIFFGDDDSFVLPHAIDQLYLSMQEKGAAIASTRALYMKSAEDLHDVAAFLAKEDQVQGALFNFAEMELNFHIHTHAIRQVPICHAYFLVRTTDARRIRFDEHFIGNCFREESDFTLRAGASGLKIIYNPFVAQFNYPRALATGGASGMPKLKYVYFSVVNNWYFLKKNQSLIRSQLKVGTALWLLQLKFTLKLFKQAVKVTLRDLLR